MANPMDALTLKLSHGPLNYIRLADHFHEKLPGTNIRTFGYETRMVGSTMIDRVRNNTRVPKLAATWLPAELNQRAVQLTTIELNSHSPTARSSFSCFFLAYGAFSVL